MLFDEHPSDPHTVYVTVPEPRQVSVNVPDPFRPVSESEPRVTVTGAVNPDHETVTDVTPLDFAPALRFTVPLLVGAVVVVDEGAVVDVLELVVVELDVVVVPPDAPGSSQLPRPEQRSKPTLHAAPLFPTVMSRNVDGARPYTYVLLTCTPSTADRAAHIGADALVPPTRYQPVVPLYGVESYTDTPEAGSASSATSGVARVPLQPVWPYCEKLRCAAVADSHRLHPPPPSVHPVSEKFVEPMLFSRVPPTEITFGDADGYSAGVPLSPADTKKLTVP